MNLIFDRGCYNAVTVGLNQDLTGYSASDITAKIWALPDDDSQEILEWTVVIDDADAGEITLSYNDTSGTITASEGWMMVTLTSGSGDVRCFDDFLGVELRG